MPIHEFKCEECGHEFEELVPQNTDPIADCPKCGSAKTSTMLSAGSVRPHGIPTGGGGWKVPPCQCGNKKCSTGS